MITLENFYRSDEWQAFRKVVIADRTGDDGFVYCAVCGKPILKKYDLIIHHKQALDEANVADVTVSLNPDNVECVHFKCHNVLHDRWQGRKPGTVIKREYYARHVYLVYGSPCAGKSTWVRDVAYDDDLILDLDEIWESICKSDRLHKPDRLKPNVFGIRDCIIDQIRMRKGMWRNAYIIGGYPMSIERKRLCDLLRAEPVFINTDYGTCIKRAPNEEWREYINNWFESYTE